ncbi:hypothetical protein ACFLRA_00770 [Bdellovibrionota bacterium]
MKYILIAFLSCLFLVGPSFAHNDPKEGIIEFETYGIENRIPSWYARTFRLLLQDLTSAMEGVQYEWTDAINYEMGGKVLTKIIGAFSIDNKTANSNHHKKTLNIELNPLIGVCVDGEQELNRYMGDIFEDLIRGGLVGDYSLNTFYDPDCHADRPYWAVDQALRINLIYFVWSKT